jgi:hypothetical protein
MHLLLACLVAGLLSVFAASAQNKDKADPALQGLKGKVESVTSKSLDLQTPSGVVHIAVQHPLTTYGRIPSDLSHVTSNSFIGVTSVKQPDGTEMAKEIHIFPAALRGLSAGSNMLPAPAGTPSQSRMTNGSVSRPATAASASRMTNGTVQKQGTTIVVHYQDGSQTITVPADVEVTQIVPQKAILAAGDTVNAIVSKKADGTFTTSKVYIISGGTRTSTASK